MEHAVQPVDLPAEILPRIRMTQRCHDCDPIEKVANAGAVVLENGERVQIMHNGIRVVADGYCGAWMTAIIQSCQGHHEPQEEWAFHQILKLCRPGTNILELGSYWSFYSLWFLKEVANSKAILVEPDIAHLEVGRKNFAINQQTGEFILAFLGRQATPPQPFRTVTDGMEHPIPMESVDSLLKNRSAEVILCDIQGYEHEMLLGSQKAIAEGKVRFLVVSTHHHSISRDPLMHQKCLDFVKTNGGHILAEHSIPESYSGDGLILASFDPADRALAPIPISLNRASEGMFPELEYEFAELQKENERLKQQLAAASIKRKLMRLFRKPKQSRAA